MTEPLIITVSGLRGIVGENLTAAVAANYGCAFGVYLRKYAPQQKDKLSVCIGRDSRISGSMLSSAVIAGLSGAGVEVIDLGMVITPSVSVMVRHLGCDGGVMITASHNPIQYNGIKLLLADGMAPPPDKAEQVRQCYLDMDSTFVDSHGGGVALNCQTYEIHISKVLALVDKEAIAREKFRVVLDSVNGAAGPITKRLLAELGCESIAINDEPTGLFNHMPEPTAQNVSELCEVVKNESAQIGFAQDPDGDRLAIVDENGTYIGEEYTLALAAKYVFRHRKGPAATNLSTSRMIDDIAEKAGCKVFRTAVGEANVAAAMRKHNCIIGGEGNGGVIDLRIGPVRDSLVGIALVLQLMAETDKTVSDLVSEIGGYCMSKDKFSADESQAHKIISAARELFAKAKVDTKDGCRFDFDDAWLHLRASNTEPVMRLIVEAKDENTLRKYIDAVMNIRRKVIGWKK